MERPAHWQARSIDTRKDKSAHDQAIWERYAIDVTGPLELTQ